MKCVRNDIGCMRQWWCRNNSFAHFNLNIMIQNIFFASSNSIDWKIKIKYLRKMFFNLKVKKRYCRGNSLLAQKNIRNFTEKCASHIGHIETAATSLAILNVQQNQIKLKPISSTKSDMNSRENRPNRSHFHHHHHRLRLHHLHTFATNYHYTFDCVSTVHSLPL